MNCKENTTLFKLPRALVLSTRTSTLPKLLQEDWKKYGLGKGWVGLILCMLWEESRVDGKWKGYFGVHQRFSSIGKQIEFNL